VPIAHVRALVAEEIARHNARPKRRTLVCGGIRSFDEVFAESYRAAPIGKATPEQLRMALLSAEQKLVNRQTAEIELFGNRYWSPACGRLAGQRVTVRFDPENLHAEIHLYAQEGHYLASAELIADTGFLDVAGAKASAKRAKDYRRRMRDAAEAEQLLVAEEVAALQADYEAPAVPEPSIIRPVRHRHSNAALKPQIAANQERETRLFDRLRLVEDE
jgi:hypothetical protein